MTECKRISPIHDGQVMAHPAMLCSESAPDIKLGVTTVNIRVGNALPGPGAPVTTQSYDYKSLIGRRAQLLPAGENASFDAQLPRWGNLTRQVALNDWGTDWLVFTCEEPAPFGAYCLLRARWHGHPIGSDFCPVFVLTDESESLSKKVGWLSKDFQFVSWAEVRV